MQFFKPKETQKHYKSLFFFRKLQNGLRLKFGLCKMFWFIFFGKNLLMLLIHGTDSNVRIK